ncbi:hypothetical protein ANASTE_01583 [Anaerofustis stercorihominis DSM 17244]|uniref:HTH cro/C1-type domain-containing protein n=1 Tax=Anaerofustis stercorihominis DSM 17244 TaxID=445971 RepID=B1CC83_9FIRM|nr:hypothetical protein [Anaerofustis stercorihominis]EDS71880.1 hypothetical protein ANASTE_01583 [Anaerofustis stercorihominis DSM 17244]
MKPYYKLRGKLTEQDKQIKDFEKLLNRSNFYITQIMTGKKGKYFREDEIYKIIDYIGESVKDMGKYFNEEQRKGI